MKESLKRILVLVPCLLVIPFLGGCQSPSSTKYLNSTPPPGPNAHPLAPNMHKKLPGPAKMASG